MIESTPLIEETILHGSLIIAGWRILKWLVHAQWWSSAFCCLSPMVFGSHEELMNWVQNLARSLGVVVVTKRSNKYPNGFVYKVVIMCDRGGKYKVKDSSKVSGTKKTDCPFELEGKYSIEYNSWTLTMICDEHNHPPVQHMEGHPYAKRLTDDEFSLVAELTRMNVAPRDILSILKERNLSNASIISTIYNARTKIRMSEQAGNSPMQSQHRLDKRCFKLLRGFVSNEALDIILADHESWKNLQVDSSNCGCRLHNSCGLLCACELSMYISSGQCISLDSIDIFWRKLDFVPSTTVQDDDNVKGDGNCGFRAIAVCLGLDEEKSYEYIRQQMREELQNRYDIYKDMFVRDVNSLYHDLCFFGSPCPEEHWMKMPEAGVLIANRFGVIIHSLSMSGSTTIFPFWSGPEES
ncbi:uncharacterized protein LOC143587288 [Bidens hawaiensis]|uniref:uncharacterized protein LOC143587288 n=1 Tax=Bidens hawaiensis TaxID=980011 RepID=UPI00404A1AFC